MAKLLAVTIIVIAIASAIPIVLLVCTAPADISLHGKLIDEQMSETMIEAGICFLAAQILLGLFVWRYSNRPATEKITRLPGGARGMVVAALVVVGLEVMALGAFGTRAWGAIYYTPASPDALQVQAQAEQVAYDFRYPGARWVISIDDQAGVRHDAIHAVGIEAVQYLLGPTRACRAALRQ